jgi:hypothetical protein
MRSGLREGFAGSRQSGTSQQLTRQAQALELHAGGQPRAASSVNLGLMRSTSRASRIASSCRPCFS